MSVKYDVQQVCEDGHQVTGRYDLEPEDRQEFCKQCGAKTIIACPDCDKKIQGAPIEVRQAMSDGRLGRPQAIAGRRAKVPSYCPACGKAYPWTQTRIRAAIQNFMEFADLSEGEKQTIEQDVENIAKDSPGAELSARRIKRIWERGKPVCYEATMEFASRTAANVLRGP